MDFPNGTQEIVITNQNIKEIPQKGERETELEMKMVARWLIVFMCSEEKRQLQGQAHAS